MTEIPSPQQPDRRTASRLRGLRPAAVIGGLAIALLAAGGVALATRSPPDLTAALRQSPPGVVFLASDGAPFAHRGTWRAPPVTPAGLPASVSAPFIAIEDRRFHQHHGLDLRGTTRAALANLRAGKVVQGGSTITQQLAKTLVGSDRTWDRKGREAITALAIERHYTKDEILAAYLNAIYFGEGAYGLGAAAHTYFGKAPAALTSAEAALLAGLVKAPSQLSPRRNLAAAHARQAVVVRAMAQAGLMTEVEAAQVGPARLAPVTPRTELGGYFADWLYPQAAADLPPAFGESAVQTTLDRDLQAEAEAVVRAALARDGKSGRVSQAALVAMRPDGSVVAMVGGRDYAASQFNRAAQAVRQPGSAFKLFAYLAAFRAGATPDSLVSDAPLSIDGWTPANSDRQSDGWLTFDEAFARSSNLAAVRISERVGRDRVILAARDLGITTPLAATPSLPLGVSGVNLVELTGAYAAVAAGAYPIRAAGLAHGAASEAAPTPMDPAREQAPLLQVLHSAAQRGTGQAAVLPIPVFGKTGTSQNYRDAVFVGFAGDLVVGVWVGNDDERPMNRIAGGVLPAQIWRSFMERALADEISAAAEPAYPPEWDRPQDPEFGPEPPRRRLWDRLRSWLGV